MSQLVLLASTPLAEVHQDYLLQARQMQALSFVVHIPLVCFGIAFPALVLFVEWLFLRTGDELYRTLARRWTKVMAALIAGFTGSLTVISVNGWMNHPTGFHLREGKAVDVHPVQALFGNSYFWHELVHMYLAGYMVTGFLVAAAYAMGRLRGRWGRYERTALAIPLAVAARWRRKRLPESRWFYGALVLAGPLSIVALICGWVTTEVGRQPWVVYRVMRTSQAVTGAGGIPVGYATLALVYLGLALAVAWILLRLARVPLDPAAAAPTAAEEA